MKPTAFVQRAIAAGLLLLSGSVFAGTLDNWHWRNPLPNGNPQPGPHTLHGVVFANGEFVAIGDSGVVSISPDGTNWTESATATTTSLNAIAYVNSLFVAVGNNGVVESSSDGTNWMLGASGTTNSLYAVTYGNGEFLAISTNGITITSANAVSWTPHFWGTNFTGVTYGNAGFMAVNGGSQIYLSSDGLTWTGETIYSGTFYHGTTIRQQIVTFVNGVYVVDGWGNDSSYTAQVYMFTSPDGNNWATNLVGEAVTLNGYQDKFFALGGGNPFAIGQEGSQGGLGPVHCFTFNGLSWASAPTAGINITYLYSGASGNGVSVLVGSTSPDYPMLPPIFTSVDGTNWVNQQHPPAPPTGPTNMFTSIAFTNGTYAVAASNSIVQSTNGLVYTIVSNSPALSSVITYGNSFVGVGSGGNIYVSGDGLSWTQRNSGTLSNLRGVTGGSGLLVAVGDNGAIQTSPTGTIWTSRTSGTSLTLYGAAYANGIYVAVGYLGMILTSPDGISWTGQYSGTLSNLLSVTYGAAGFAAVGPGGTIITSADGVNWTQQNAGVLASFESITFGNGYYLATGDGAVAMTSPDGVNWTSRNTGAIGGQNFYGSAFLNSRFDIVGSGGTILESDPVAPLFDLQIHPGGNQLTAFAPPGSSFRIQTCTNLVAPVWSDAAVFDNASAITQWTNNVSGFNELFYRAVSP